MAGGQKLPASIRHLNVLIFSVVDISIKNTKIFKTLEIISSSK